LPSLCSDGSLSLGRGLALMRPFSRALLSSVLRLPRHGLARSRGQPMARCNAAFPPARLGQAPRPGPRRASQSRQLQLAIPGPPSTWGRCRTACGVPSRKLTLTTGPLWPGDARRWFASSPGAPDCPLFAPA